MTMPNFLIVGVMKSGTTALYYYLEQHPQIYMSPVKEANFFCFEGQKNAHVDSITDIETPSAPYQLALRRWLEDPDPRTLLGRAGHDRVEPLTDP